ncbi:BolA family protein [Candidatus Riesia pediculicola]|uniref:BolA/YrbA family protein n=1 Tax=Riesia pediculicola (strain USDA) TaxID=515618 RepID=D4G7J4_RIEPU|nr:BolA/IbaG family iron-sulfur metabolism protein [Candidatus Riesia pediculicola]ADD79666.1 BolA/YrbA family protein [Candidatus Riesia pediculicola USDA]ARC53575.1 hypothetical protein AOE55_00150 [Candidatus Riesia pediculicola]QOJ86230.1 BolA/IbaG family iron-sulfur metabolism protein [Candidatus Riesia pediculicola]
MDVKKIQEILNDALKPQMVFVTGNQSYFKIFIVDDIFKKMNSVQRQRRVYEVLTKYIKDGSIHALSIYTYSVNEWKEIEKKE